MLKVLVFIATFMHVVVQTGQEISKGYQVISKSWQLRPITKLVIPTAQMVLAMHLTNIGDGLNTVLCQFLKENSRCVPNNQGTFLLS